MTSELSVSGVIFLLTTLCFSIANSRYSGPVILPDEMGYLGYGGFFGGHSIDAASSFHFGYSLFLAPLFWGLSTTEAIWNGLTVVNGAFFGGALVICHRLSREMFPSRSLTMSVLTVGLCALYPAWISISGYAFSQGCFAFFFALTTYLLVKSPTSKACAIGASATAAFLFWIHELGIVCCVMTALMVWVSGRNFRLTIASAALMLVSVGAYVLWLSPAVKAAMTPAGFAPITHYPSALSALDILSLSGLMEASTRALGQVSYLLIVTLGLAATPLLIALSAALGAARGKFERSPLHLVSLFAVGCTAGMTIFSAAMFTVVETATRQDHWMYGRYNEGALLPILLIGLSIKPGRIALALTLVVPALFAILVALQAPEADPLSVINSAAFWPAVAFPDANFSRQILIGAIGAGAVIAIASSGIAAVVLLAAFVICLPRQFQWHDMASNVQRMPQAVALIRDQIPRGACIGFAAPAGFSRLHFIGFYLFDYRYSRMKPSQWATTCDGPFLSQSDGPSDADWVAVGDRGRMFGKGATPMDHYSNLAFADAGACAEWCYVADAEKLSLRSQNGQLVDGALAASGPSGFLFFGPYIKVEKGRYLLNLSGTGSGESHLDVVTDAGRNVLAQYTISALNPTGSEFFFDVPSDVKDLEIRLSVPAGAQMAVTGYVLSKQPDSVSVAEIAGYSPTQR
ncbi:hypothetical protein LB579_29260 [Mesorhizobium sp. BR1-1-7]|uniref:hypothetical protein n=1 Tax=Mesorhizobium sp. BR1-1-7 TaxID=2876647 RepID=UPI001CCD279C|nr:hypothetical protein [Mesorhizobium sp. BR1-1-7]MBZ9921784.1 hypothetical protein [Mesorhizobium sp. BR1-1-7]